MAAPKKGGWGSLLSGAVANLESRLDTILADDSTAPARERTAAEEALRQAKANRPRTNSGSLNVPSRSASVKDSRDSSRTRTNDRLAERLAKATQQKAASRAGTPVTDPDSARASIDVKRSIDIARPPPDIHEPEGSDDSKPDKKPNANGDDAGKVEENELRSSDLPLNPARSSVDSSHPSIESTAENASTRHSVEIANGLATKSHAELLADIQQMQAEHAQAETQRQEEIHTYMERIDALQAKLTYLAKETVAAAKEANATAGTSSADKQLAEKDERIALLMEEGQKLSVSEMKHLQTIKKLRTSKTAEDKASSELRRRLERTERAEADLKVRLRRAEAAERQANEKVKQIAVIEKQVDELRVDRENAADLVRSLTAQLKDAKEKAAQAEKQAEVKASEADNEKITALQHDLEDAQIERKLADDRAAAELRKATEEAGRQKERFGVQELELKNEIFALEARLETLRTRAEEASATGGGVEGESSIKLLRQVETLQQQYTLAKGNWETIEGSLNARVAVLEKERDDATKRENEIRKKARDVGARSRKAEDQLDSTLDQVKALEKDVTAQREQIGILQSSLAQAEAAQTDARAELERQRKVWDAELSQRIEDEKLKWRRELAVSPSRPDLPARKSSALDGLSSFTRRPTSRALSNDVHGDQQRPSSRRSANMPRVPGPEPSPSLSRRESEMSFETHATPLTPSIEIEHYPSDDFDTSSSPQRTINDIVSTSTAGPGPGASVQMVERMSAMVRKLESEKASFKDELGRLGAQRDDARNEIVTLMREVETKRDQERKVLDLEKELTELTGRYNASLEMLGEREEEVDELKLDVVELKRIYRELVETKVGG